MEIDILNYIQTLRTPIGDVLMPFISSLGNGGFVWIVLDIALIIIPKTRKAGIVVAFAIILDVLLCNGLLKPLVARIRPCNVVKNVNMLIPIPKDFSFPSGHTTASFAVALVMLRMLPKKFGIPAVVLAALVAFSRLYLGVHYPTDVLAGFVIALVGSTLSVWIVRTKPEDKQVH